MNLVELINSVETEGDPRKVGLPQAVRDFNYELGEDIEKLGRFVHVSSEFYPGLEGYHEAEAAEWVADKLAEREREDE